MHRTPARATAIPMPPIMQRIAFTAASAAMLLTAAAPAALAQSASPPGDFTAEAEAALLDLTVLRQDDGSTLTNIGVAESATSVGDSDAGDTAASSFRNLRASLLEENLGALIVEEGSAHRPDDASVQFAGVPLSTFGGIGSGEGSITHATRTNRCVETPAYSRSQVNVYSVDFAPDAFDAKEEGDENADTGLGEQNSDEDMGGGLDDGADGLNEGLTGVGEGLDPATEGIDDAVDAFFTAAGMPVPGGALFDLSSPSDSGVGSTSQVRVLPTDRDGFGQAEVRAYVDVVNFGVLGEAVHVDVIRPAGITVRANGTPGGASVEYTAPILSVQVVGEDAVRIGAGDLANEFEIPGLLKIEIGELVTSTVSDAGTAASGSAYMARVQILDPEQAGVQLLDLTLNPVSASTTVPTDGVPCVPENCELIPDLCCDEGDGAAVCDICVGGICEPAEPETCEDRGDCPTTCADRGDCPGPCPTGVEPCVEVEREKALPQTGGSAALAGMALLGAARAVRGRFTL